METITTNKNATEISATDIIKNRSELQKEILKEMANDYNFLMHNTPWDKKSYVAAMSEGISKFLSNNFLNLASNTIYKYKKIKIAKSQKFRFTDFISDAAEKQIELGNFQNLVFEHVVPKEKYIQNPCKTKVKYGTLTDDFVLDLLSKYWVLATITKEEDAALSRTSMPEDWDGICINSRYIAGSIKLIKNKFNMLC